MAVLYQVRGVSELSLVAMAVLKLAALYSLAGVTSHHTAGEDILSLFLRGSLVAAAR